MKEGPVTYDEVVRVAIRILREGRNITKPLVRERLGDRGSHTTIQKHLDTWRETLSESDLEVLPPAMPVELTPHLEAFWNAATSIVESNLSSEWERAKEAIDAAEHKAQVAELEREQWEVYARDKDADLVRKNDEIKDLRHQLSKVEERLSLRDIEYQGLLSKLDDKEEAMAAERETMSERLALLVSKQQQDTEALQARWDIERQRLEEEAEAAKARAALEVRRSDQHEIYFMKEIDKARTEAARARTVGEESVARVEQELLISRRREEAGSVRLGQMENRLMALQDDRDELADKSSTLRETLAIQEIELNKFRDLVVSLESEKEKLETDIKDLRKDD